MHLTCNVERAINNLFVSGNKSLSQAFRRRKSNDDILSASVQEELRGGDSQIAPVKNLPSGSQSWSTPTSPYYQGSRNLFVRITSPVVCAKLQTFPKAKMRLPPKVSIVPPSIRLDWRKTAHFLHLKLFQELGILKRPSFNMQIFPVPWTLLIRSHAQK